MVFFYGLMFMLGSFVSPDAQYDSSPDKQPSAAAREVRDVREAESILRLALSTDAPSRAAVLRWLPGDSTVTRQEMRERTERIFPEPPRETQEQRAKRLSNIELNVEMGLRQVQEGAMSLSRFRRTAEGERSDYTRFEIGDEVTSNAPAQMTWIIPAEGGGPVQMVDHLTKRRTIMSQRPAAPDWLLNGGRSPRGLREFFRLGLTVATGKAPELNAEIKPEWTQLLLSPPGTVEKWPWQTTLETREDGSVVFRASLPNHKEAMIEAVFPDERLQTVRTFISRNPTTGEEMFRREVQRTNEEGIPLEFWVEEAQVGGKPPKRTRYVIEEWVVAEERGGPPLVTEDWSDYTDGRMPR